MALTVIYDANVLYPSTLRDLLIRLAQSGAVQAKWTDRILDEVFDSLRRNRPDLDPSRLARTRELMLLAVRDVLVDGYQPLIEKLRLPDPDDRHVLAAAIQAQATQVITNNVKDFPAHELDQWHIRAVTPDAFVLDLLHTDPELVHRAVQSIASAWRNPPGTVQDVLERLVHDGLARAVESLRT